MIKICIPSRGRPDSINTDTLRFVPEDQLSNVYVFVNPAEQLEQYKKLGDPRVNYIPVPHTGNIAKVRNFILDYFKEGEELFIVDDDIVGIEDGNRKKYTEMTKIIEAHFRVTRKLGAKIFGFEPVGNPMNCEKTNVYTRFGFIIQAMGVINSDMRFDEELLLKEDIGFSCEHFYRYGLTPIFMRFTFRGRTKTNKGGCQEYRNDSGEEQSAMYLIKKYPDLLELKSRTEVKRKNVVGLGKRTHF